LTNYTKTSSDDSGDILLTACWGNEFQMGTMLTKREKLWADILTKGLKRHIHTVAK